MCAGSARLGRLDEWSVCCCWATLDDIPTHIGRAVAATPLLRITFICIMGPAAGLSGTSPPPPSKCAEAEAEAGSNCMAKGLGSLGSTREQLHSCAPIAHCSPTTARLLAPSSPTFSSVRAVRGRRPVRRPLLIAGRCIQASHHTACSHSGEGAWTVDGGHGSAISHPHTSLAVTSTPISQCVAASQGTWIRPDLGRKPRKHSDKLNCVPICPDPGQLIFALMFVRRELVPEQAHASIASVQ